MNRTPDPAEQPRTGPRAANSPQGEGECGCGSLEHAERHTAESSPAPKRAQGGYIPPTGPPIGHTITVLRHVEPGLSVVSIDNGRPEYLISQDWIRRNPGKVPLGMPPEARGWKPGSPTVTAIALLPCDRGIPGNALSRGWHQYEAGVTGRVICRYCGQPPATVQTWTRPNTRSEESQ